jgi:hypothetical protein
MGVPRTLACVIFSSQHEAATMLVHADKKWATVNEINSSHHQRAGVAEVYFPVPSLRSLIGGVYVWA